MRILICDDDKRALNNLKEMTEEILTQHIMTDTIKYAEINDRHVNIYTDIGMYEAI